MTIREMNQIAKRVEISAHGLSKQDLIRKIHRREGNFDIFASVTDGVCDQDSCLWRDGCLGLSAAMVHRVSL